MIHISSIYSCPRVNTASELFYIAELARYIRIFGDDLSLAGVVIQSKLKLNKYYIYLQRMNIEGVEKDIDNYTDYEYEYPDTEDEEERLKKRRAVRYFTTDLSSVDLYFAEKKPIEWVFDYDGGGRVTTNNFFFKGLLAKQAYLSLAAYVTAHKVIYGSPKSLVFDFQNANICLTGSYSSWDITELWVVYNKTKALEGWVTIKLPNVEKAKAQLNLESFVSESQLTGSLSRHYSIQEKMEHYKENFKKGDIVFLYSRGKEGNRSNVAREIQSCRIARIEKATNRSIQLTIFNVNNSLLSRKKEQEMLPEKLKALYGVDYYRKVDKQVVVYDWLDIGVGDKTYLEEYFITDLNSWDSQSMFFTRPDGSEVELELVGPDAVYALLDERDIEFNKERFENLYFSKVPSTYKREVLGL